MPSESEGAEGEEAVSLVRQALSAHTEDTFGLKLRGKNKLNLWKYFKCICIIGVQHLRLQNGRDNSQARQRLRTNNVKHDYNHVEHLIGVLQTVQNPIAVNALS